MSSLLQNEGISGEVDSYSPLLYDGTQEGDVLFQTIVAHGEMHIGRVACSNESAIAMSGRVKRFESALGPRLSGVDIYLIDDPDNIDQGLLIARIRNKNNDD